MKISSQKKLIEIKKRFDEKYIPEPMSGCWLWTAYANQAGYGAIRFNKKTNLAHRISFLIFKGSFNKNFHVCHKCDTPSCVNPHHLFLGTDQTNRDDMMRKKRHWIHKRPEISKKWSGEKSSHHVLNEKQVLKIRKNHISGKLSPKDLSIKYGITREAIYMIVNRKNWKHI